MLPSTTRWRNPTGAQTCVSPPRASAPPPTRWGGSGTHPTGNAGTPRAGRAAAGNSEGTGTGEGSSGAPLVQGAGALPVEGLAEPPLNVGPLNVGVRRLRHVGGALLRDVTGGELSEHTREEIG